MFEKKVVIYKKKDRASWKAIRDVLKEEGIKGVSASHYEVDAVKACGCGSKLDPRDFGAKGKIDRDVYQIKVRVSESERALAAIRAHGLVPEIDETVTMDAAEKHFGAAAHQ